MDKNIKNILLSPFNLLYKIAPTFEQLIMFRLKMGYRLKLENPLTYNEKVNWIKIKYRNELMPRCADKFLAREYIKECGYEEYLPKLLWHGDDPEKIPFDSLPDSFVIKSTSGSGNNIIVHDKGKINYQEIKHVVSKWLKEKYLLAYGEWIYEKIVPSIIVEELLSDGVHVVPEDYKLFYFNNYNNKGSGVGCVAVDIGRFVKHKRNIFNGDFEFLKEVRFAFQQDFTEIAKKPSCFDKMCEITNELGKPFPHCRVDFYVINERFYIGEITFFNGAGYDRVTPYEFNLEMGNWIKLPQ